MAVVPMPSLAGSASADPQDLPVGLFGGQPEQVEGLLVRVPASAASTAARASTTMLLASSPDGMPPMPSAKGEQSPAGVGRVLVVVPEQPDVTDHLGSQDEAQ